MSCYQLLEGGRPAFGMGTIVSLDGMGRPIGCDVLTFTYNPAAGTSRLFSRTYIVLLYLNASFCYISDIYIY